MTGAQTSGKLQAHLSGDMRFDLLEKTLKRTRFRQDALIEVLHSAQDIFGYLSPDILHYVARKLKLPPSRVYGVATFYHLFSFTPKGEHSCTVCLGTACYVGGAPAIALALEQSFGIRLEQTTADKQLSLGSARCLGSCGLAPVLVIDGEVCGRMNSETALAKVYKQLEETHHD